MHPAPAMSELGHQWSFSALISACLMVRFNPDSRRLLMGDSRCSQARQDAIFAPRYPNCLRTRGRTPEPLWATGADCPPPLLPDGGCHESAPDQLRARSRPAFIARCRAASSKMLL